MAKATVENLDRGQLELMWSFLKMGNGMPNISALKGNLDLLRQMMIQKTAGQDPYGKSHEIPYEYLDTIINCIVIETMQLYLSGGLDNLGDVMPVKHGHWVETAHKGYKCSLCNCLSSLFDENLKSEFCPWCGAKMDGGD